MKIKPMGPCWDGDALERGLFTLADQGCWGLAACLSAAAQVTEATGHKFEPVDLDQDTELGPRWVVMKSPEIGDEICIQLEAGPLLWSGVVWEIGKRKLLTSRGHYFTRASEFSNVWNCSSPRGVLVMAGPGMSDLGAT